MAPNMDLFNLLTVEHCPVNIMHCFILNRMNKVGLKYIILEGYSANIYSCSLFYTISVLTFDVP
jgi:hypothetical protein